MGPIGQGGESCIFLHQNPPKASPSCISNALQRVFSSLPSELSNNKPRSALGQYLPAAVTDQAGREKGGSALGPPLTHPDIPARNNQPWLPQDKACISLSRLRREGVAGLLQQALHGHT